MTTDHDEFLEQLPMLLDMLSDPITIHTPFEVWCRIERIGWDECVPVLRSELLGGSTEVQLLILDVIKQHAEILGCDAVESFVSRIVSMLDDENSSLRWAGVGAIATALGCVLASKFSKRFFTESALSHFS